MPFKVALRIKRHASARHHRPWAWQVLTVWELSLYSEGTFSFLTAGILVHAPTLAFANKEALVKQNVDIEEGYFWTEQQGLCAGSGCPGSSDKPSRLEQTSKGRRSALSVQLAAASHGGLWMPAHRLAPGSVLSGESLKELPHCPPLPPTSWVGARAGTASCVGQWTSKKALRVVFSSQGANPQCSAFLSCLHCPPTVSARPSLQVVPGTKPFPLSMPQLGPRSPKLPRCPFRPPCLGLPEPAVPWV